MKMEPNNFWHPCQKSSYYTNFLILESCDKGQKLVSSCIWYLEISATIEMNMHINISDTILLLSPFGTQEFVNIPKNAIFNLIELVLSLGKRGPYPDAFGKVV